MRRIHALIACASVGMTAMSGLGTAKAKCHQTGVASAPIISRSDMKSLERAVVRLPAVRRKTVVLSIGRVVPKVIDTAPVPAAVRKVLPQYAGYRAFRTGYELAIVKPGSRRLAYVLPLRGAAPARCP